MIRLLLAVALVISCATSLAASDKTLIKGKRTQVESTTVPHKTAVPRRKKEEKKPSKGEIKDPYWEPCDYASTNGPNACGGGS